MQITNLITTLLITASAVRAALPLGSFGKDGDITFDTREDHELESRGDIVARKTKKCITGACECKYDDESRCAFIGFRCACDWFKGTAERTSRDCITLPVAKGRTKCGDSPWKD